MKKIRILPLFMLFITSMMVLGCSKDDIKVEPKSQDEEQKEEEKEDETQLPSGSFLFSIEIPAHAIRKDVDKLHFVLYDNDNRVLTHKSHTSGNAEILEFYAAEPLEDDLTYTLSRITNFQESVFTVRLYMDLSGAQLKNGIRYQENAVDRRTNILELPIVEMEEGHGIWSQGWGYSLIGTNGTLEGHFSSDYKNDLGTENLLIQYLGEDGISNYRYLFLSSEELKNQVDLDVTTFTNEATRSGRIDFYKPFSRTLIRILGYEDETRFEANIGHTVHTSNNLSDYGGARYSHANIFPRYLSSVQLENYELQQVGLPPNEINLPELSVDYSYEQGRIFFNGISDYEVSRFLLRASTSNEIHVTTEIVTDGSRTEISIPEVPIDLFTQSVREGLAVSKLILQQGASENYDGYETYSDYITNTLLIDKPYYLEAPKRERIFKSSVSTQLLPF